MTVLDQAQALIREGWRIEYYGGSVIAYQNCRWCKADRRAMKKCDLCKGTGAEQTRTLA